MVDWSTMFVPSQPVAETVLRAAGLATLICPDVPCLVTGMQDGAGLALVTHETLIQDVR